MTVEGSIKSRIGNPVISEQIHLLLSTDSRRKEKKYFPIEPTVHISQLPREELHRLQKRGWRKVLRRAREAYGDHPELANSTSYLGAYAEENMWYAAHELLTREQRQQNILYGVVEEVTSPQHAANVIAMITGGRVRVDPSGSLTVYAPDEEEEKGVWTPDGLLTNAKGGKDKTRWTGGFEYTLTLSPRKALNYYQHKVALVKGFLGAIAALEQETGRENGVIGRMEKDGTRTFELIFGIPEIPDEGNNGRYDRRIQRYVESLAKESLLPGGFRLRVRRMTLSGQKKKQNY